ncbi:unnamed protein product [Allacma fusca]|uniref:Fe2OG dioxygenase domain-containing protein n=1 Tax=Allacma fusca TaxID=39272 RepID=A0A8J2LQS0_9HEXA|nr:unnamed protein product [Allacma fusca]
MTSIPFIEFSLWTAIEKHNMEFDDAIKMDLEPAFFDREISHVPNDSRGARKIRNLQQEAFKGIREFSYESINYWSLCSGEQLQTEIEKSYLFCCAKMTPSTYENQDYQLVSKKMDKKAYVLYHRTSVTYFFKFSKEKEFDQKTELLTGMIVTKTNASEDLQVLSYSVGAHISPHVDEMGFTSHTNQPSTFRIATWMLYLNDVKLGGETAFVSAGVRAKPVKGSAVLWFNIFSDGTTDWASNHASCPILLGEKWGADKWVKYGAQIVNRKCSLKQGERYQYPVNNVYLPVPKIPGRN